MRLYHTVLHKSKKETVADDSSHPGLATGRYCLVSLSHMRSPPHRAYVMRYPSLNILDRVPLHKPTDIWAVLATCARGMVLEMHDSSCTSLDGVLTDIISPVVSARMPDTTSNAWPGAYLIWPGSSGSVTPARGTQRLSCVFTPVRAASVDQT